jgi:hypothetical protein
MKRTLQPFAIKMVVALAALFAVGRMVFVAKVFENAPSVSQVSDFGAFFVRAFTHTEFAVQAVILAVTIAGILALRDVAKTISMVRELKLVRA